MIINEVPFVFKTGFYGTVSLLVAIMIVYTIAMVFVFSVLLRIFAYYKKWSIPLA